MTLEERSARNVALRTNNIIEKMSKGGGRVRVPVQFTVVGAGGAARDRGV